MFETLRNFWRVAKPGIIFANLISTAGGFCLASRGRIDSPLLAWTLTGMALMVASACVFNNWIDRDIDQKMARTRHRVLAQGRMSSTAAIIFGTLLGAAGATLLLLRTNGITLAAVLSGFAVYVGLYSLYLKRASGHAVVIGSLAGAAPPVAGYCTASGCFDPGALLLAVIFSLWQIPHAYAIAVLRREEYAAAGIPVFAVRRGAKTAKRHIVGYIIAFQAAALMLALGRYAGYTYFAVVATVGLLWLILALQGFHTTDEHRWARNVYAFSILMVTILSVMMSVDAVNPLNTNLLLSYLP